MKIGLIAPSGVIAQEDLDRCLKFLEKEKIDFRYSENICQKHYFFAGTVKQRIDDILQLIKSEDLNYLWAFRGGSGSIQLLSDFDKLLEQGNFSIPSLIGFSDVSTVLNYLAVRTGKIMIHSHSAKSLVQALDKEKEIFWQRLRKHQWEGNLAATYESQLVVLCSGSVSGVLVGGNLTTLVSLIGTPWQIDLRDKILFLEDINEAYYRIERLFSQLYYAGNLERIRGLVLGQFLYQEKPLEFDLIYQLIRDYLPQAIPVLGGFPSGHGTQNVPLPIGAEVVLDASSKILKTTVKKLIL